VKVPVASEMLRCAPPHTLRAGEEPEEGAPWRLNAHAERPRLNGLKFHGRFRISASAVIGCYISLWRNAAANIASNPKRSLTSFASGRHLTFPYNEYSSALSL